MGRKSSYVYQIFIHTFLVSIYGWQNAPQAISAQKYYTSSNFNLHLTFPTWKQKLNKSIPNTKYRIQVNQIQNTSFSHVRTVLKQLFVGSIRNRTAKAMVITVWSSNRRQLLYCSYHQHNLREQVLELDFYWNLVFR